MFKSLILLTSSMLMINRSVVTNNAHQHSDGYYYYTDLGGTCVTYDMTRNGDTRSFNFELSTPDRYENDEYYWDTSADTPLGSNLYGYNGYSNAILYSWSSASYTISYDDSTTMYSPSASFTAEYGYINVTASSNEGVDLITLHNSNYLLSFDVSAYGIDYLACNYYISWRSNTVDYDMNSYSGTIAKNLLSDSHFDIPYQNPSSFLPNFTDSYHLRIFISLLTDGGSGYSEGYQSGYGNGYSDGYNNGYGDGNVTGYQSGYNVGYDNGANTGNNFVRLLFAVADTPLYYLRSLFSVEIFGIKVYAVVLSMITTMVILWVVKKFVL